MANSKDNISKYATSFIGFDEASGNVYDSIGGYTGTIYNSPTRVTGWNDEGNAMNFNGSNQYIVFNGKLIDKNIFSIRFKIRFTSTKQMRILNNLSNSVGFIIECYQGYIQAYYNELNIPHLHLVSNPINDNNWHDVLYICDSDEVSLFVDNILVGTKPRTVNITHPNNLFIANDATNFGLFNGQLDELEIYDRVISPIPDKYLVLHDSQYKYHDGTQWQTTTKTESNFINYGMNDLSHITEEQWNELTGSKSVIMWSDFEDKQYASVVLEKELLSAKELLGEQYKVLVFSTTKKESNIKLNIIPANQPIYPEGDILIVGVEKIDSITINASGSGKVAISFDGGDSWKAYKNSGWEDVSDITKGMSFSELNALTTEQINEVRAQSDTIRFAYFLTEDTVIDNIKLTVTMVGSEEMLDTDHFKVCYDRGAAKVVYTIKKSGTYTLNYMD